jgi:hypothetical protein
MDARLFYGLILPHLSDCMSGMCSTNRSHNPRLESAYRTDALFFGALFRQESSSRAGIGAVDLSSGRASSRPSGACGSPAVGRPSLLRIRALCPSVVRSHCSCNHAAQGFVISLRGREVSLRKRAARSRLQVPLEAKRFRLGRKLDRHDYRSGTMRDGVADRPLLCQCRPLSTLLVIPT